MTGLREDVCACHRWLFCCAVPFDSRVRSLFEPGSPRHVPSFDIGGRWNVSSFLLRFTLTCSWQRDNTPLTLRASFLLVYAVPAVLHCIIALQRVVGAYEYVTSGSGMDGEPFQD